MLYVSIAVFTIFSALCGAARSIRWMIACRFFQGVGGGSIICLTNILIGDIVPLSKRGMYQGVVGSTWGIASALGPIIGGLLTQRASWRWCFYINLPTSSFAFVMLLFSLKLNPTKKYTFAMLRKTFDFLGLYVKHWSTMPLLTTIQDPTCSGRGFPGRRFLRCR
jgi:MFS family permease